jgi:hypothetical protein
VLAVATGILVVASLVQSIVAGVVAIRFAVAFAALIALGELLRLNLPGDRDAAPIGSACALAYALLIRVGPVPARHSAFQVVAVTGLGMILGALPHLAVGRPARLPYMSSRLLWVACVAFIFRPLAGMSDLARYWWVALAAMALLVTVAWLVDVFLSACIRVASLRARFWVTFTDELHVQGPLGVAVGASAMLIVFAAEAMGLLAVAVFIAPLLVPGSLPPVRRDPRHLPADGTGAGPGDRDRRLRRDRARRPGQSARGGGRPGARHGRARAAGAAVCRADPRHRPAVAA